MADPHGKKPLKKGLLGIDITDREIQPSAEQTGFTGLIWMAWESRF